MWRHRPLNDRRCAQARVDEPNHTQNHKYDEPQRQLEATLIKKLYPIHKSGCLILIIIDVIISRNYVAIFPSQRLNRFLSNEMFRKSIFENSQDMASFQPLSTSFLRQPLQQSRPGFAQKRTGDPGFSTSFHRTCLRG